MQYRTIGSIEFTFNSQRQIYSLFNYIFFSSCTIFIERITDNVCRDKISKKQCISSNIWFLRLIFDNFHPRSNTDIKNHLNLIPLLVYRTVYMLFKLSNYIFRPTYHIAYICCISMPHVVESLSILNIRYVLFCYTYNKVV